MFAALAASLPPPEADLHSVVRGKGIARVHNSVASPDEGVRARLTAVKQAAMPPGPPDARLETPAVQKPILQFVSAPVVLNARDFANAFSNENPEGDMRRLRAFRDLVDPLPSFTTFYSRRFSTANMYRSIVEGAVAGTRERLAQRAIAKAKHKLSSQSFANLDGTPGTWEPVYATPSDWADDAGSGLFRDLDLDFTGDMGTDGPYTLIGDPGEMKLFANGAGDNAGREIAPETRVNRVRMKYLQVSLSRPWFHAPLFETGGWWVPSTLPGYCSSGTLERNDGRLPLLPSAVLLGRDVSLDVDWSARDQAVVDRAGPGNSALGPFALHSSACSNTFVHVVAWISRLMPLSPQTTDLKPGSVYLCNRGTFVARFSVAWHCGGTVHTARSPALERNSSHVIAIPAGAGSISISIEFCAPSVRSDKWSSLPPRRLDLPKDLAFALSGPPDNPVIEEQ